MADLDFTSDERQVLGALILAPDATISDRTVKAVAVRTGMSEAEVSATLRKLDDMDPPVVHQDTDAVSGERFWIALNEAAERLDPPPPE